MIKASRHSKQLILAILTSSFDTDKSVDYIIKKDNNRSKRIRALMNYSFEISQQVGEVYLSEDKPGEAGTRNRRPVTYLYTGERQDAKPPGLSGDLHTN